LEVVVIVTGGCCLTALELTGRGTGDCVLRPVNSGARTAIEGATVDVTRVDGAVVVVKQDVVITIPDTAGAVEFEGGRMETVGSAIDGRDDIVDVYNLCSLFNIDLISIH